MWRKDVVCVVWCGMDVDKARWPVGVAFNSGIRWVFRLTLGPVKAAQGSRINAFLGRRQPARREQGREGQERAWPLRGLDLKRRDEMQSIVRKKSQDYDWPAADVPWRDRRFSSALWPAKCVCLWLAPIRSSCGWLRKLCMQQLSSQGLRESRRKEGERESLRRPG